MPEESSGSSSPWMWIIAAILILAIGWVGSALYYEYRLNQQIDESAAAAQTAADEAVSELDAQQKEMESALGARIDELTRRVDDVDESIGGLSSSVATGSTSP